MIDLAFSFFIAKFYMFGYLLCVFLSWHARESNKSNVVVSSLALVNYFVGQNIKENSTFETFYLAAALQMLMLVMCNIVVHIALRIQHAKTTLIVYCLYTLLAMSYLGMYRIRVKMFDSDERIMWIINSQSAFVLTLYFCTICLFIYGSNIRWKLLFGCWFSWLLRSYLFCLKAIKIRRK